MINHDTLFDFDEPRGRKRACASSADWQRRYDAGETAWDRGSTSPAILHWLDNGELATCRILVPGCGRGHEVIELASRGFDVTALDFAKTPVRELTHRLTEAGLVAEVLCENVLRFATSEPFDAVFEQTSLCAIDPKHWAAYETRLFQNLKPGGRLFALLMQSNKRDAPPFHCEPKKIRKLFSKARWVWPKKSFKVDHPTGMHEVAIILQKREN